MNTSILIERGKKMRKLFLFMSILLLASIFAFCNPGGSISIKVPAGGEIWGPGIHTIEWRYLGDLSSFDIHLIHPDDNESEIATDVEGADNDGSYDWDLPETLETTDGYKIKVSSGEISDTSEEFAIGETNWTKVADESELYLDFYDAVYNSDTGFNYTPRGIATAKVAPLGNDKFLAINFVVDTPTSTAPAGSTVIFSNSMMYYDGTQWVDGFWTHNTDLGSEPRANITPIDTATAIVFGGTDYPNPDQPEVNKLSVFEDGDSALTEITDATGTVPVERQEAVVTYCGSNKALVTLGFQRESGATVNIQLTSALYNYTTNAWEEAAPISDYASLAQASAYAGGNKVIIYGGYGSSGGSTEIYDRTILYDASSNTFTELSIDPNPGPLAYPSMTYIGSDDNGPVILLFGGFSEIDFDDTGSGDTVTNKTWILKNDGTDWIWQELPTPAGLTPRATSILYSTGDGVATLIGGRFDLKANDEYDQQEPFATDEWTFSYGDVTNNELP